MNQEEKKRKNEAHVSQQENEKQQQRVLHDVNSYFNESIEIRIEMRLDENRFFGKQICQMDVC